MVLFDSQPEKADLIPETITFYHKIVVQCSLMFKIERVDIIAFCM